MNEKYALDIEWDTPLPGLPRLVGPFDSRDDAAQWAGLNVVNGSWEARPLAAPYLRSQRRRHLDD